MIPSVVVKEGFRQVVYISLSAAIDGQGTRSIRLHLPDQLSELYGGNFMERKCKGVSVSESLVPGEVGRILPFAPQSGNLLQTKRYTLHFFKQPGDPSAEPSHFT